MSSATPGQVALGNMREQAEGAVGSKTVSGIPPWPLVSSCFDFFSDELWHEVHIK